MNPFRGRGFDAQQRSHIPFSVQASQRQVHPSVLPEIPQASDFRTSLILKDLSKRFSLLRSPTGDPVSVQDLKHKFAEQRRRGAKNQITEEEEVMLLETLGRMRSRASALSGKTQDTINENPEQHPIRSTNTPTSTFHASPPSSPSGKSGKRYSNNLFGSGRLRDYAYFRNAGSGHGRAGNTRAPSMTPTETSITIQEISSVPDSLHLLISDSSSVRSSTDNKLVNSFVAASASNEQAVEPSSTTHSLVLKGASMALEDAIKELEEADDEVLIPRLSRPSPDLSSRQPESIAELARSSQSSLQSPIVVEAGTAISSDNQVMTPYGDHRASPVHSRILPGYVPGMPRPMTPRDLESDEQTATPRAMSPLLAINSDNTSSSIPQPLSSVVTRSESISPALSPSPRPPSPTAAAIRPSTPSRSTPLFLQRSPSGRRTPENGSSIGEVIEFENPLNSSLMSKRRPSSPSAESAYQPMSVSSRPSTPSNIIWNVGLAESNHKRMSHERNGSWASDTSINDGSSYDTYGPRLGLTPLPDSPLVDQVFGIDFGPNLSGSNRAARSPTPTHNSPRSPGIPTVDTSPRNNSKRSSRQNTSSPFIFGQYPPLMLLPVVSSSRSSLESIGSSYHTWEGEKERCLSIFCDADTQQPVWHDVHVERSSSVSSGESTDDWDPEEIIGRYAGLKKSDFKAMQEKLVSLAAARDDARERVPSIRRRRPSTSQSNYSVNGRDRIASPPPGSPTAASEQNAKATAVLNTITDTMQARQPESINTSVQRAPDTEPSPNTRRHRDLAQALFGDDIEREREQTPKPTPVHFTRDTDSDREETSKSVETYVENGSEIPVTSGSSLGHTYSTPGSFQEVDLAREVQEKVDAATLALRKNSPNNEQRLERSILGSISRRRINPTQISGPRLVSASTSVDTIPVRPPQSNNTGSSKIGSRFRKLRGSLRVKNPPPVREEARIQSNVHSPAPSQVAIPDVSKVTLPANGTSAVENGRTKDAPSSAPTSIAPGLKGFMARFRSKKGGADNASVDRRDTPHISPSVVSLAASHADRTTLPQPTTNDSVALSSGSSFQHVSEQGHPLQEATTVPDSNEVALRQLFDAASNLGLDQNALNALLARSSSLSRPPERQEIGGSISMPNKVGQPTAEVGKRDQPMIVPPAETESETPRALPKQVSSDYGNVKSAEAPDSRAGEYRTSEDGVSETIANVAVRRIIIYPSDSQIPFDIPSLPKKASHRRRASMTSASSRSIQDRAPTPPPPKSPTSKSFTNGISPPVPQIPHSLLANAEPHRGPPHGPRHSFEKSNFAYDSLYEMYSEEVATSTGNETLPSTTKAQTNTNTEIPALELIELANGETIWSIVNGLRDDDNESTYAGRMSFASEFSAREPNSDGLQAFVKEHRKTGSKSSGSSFASRRRPLHSKVRPETKVYYSTSAQIGRLIENLSQGVDSGSFKISPDPQRPGHSASSSLSLPPSTNDAHWTVEERLEHMLESIANR